MNDPEGRNAWSPGQAARPAGQVSRSAGAPAGYVPSPNAAPVQAASPMHINKLAESRDLDECLGYLSLVSGIDGAVVYSHEGLVVAAGENTLESLLIEAPYFLSNFQETVRGGRMLGTEALESQVSFSQHRFHQIINLEQSDSFFLMVTGTRGSYELFKVRIERGAQAVGRLLYERGYIRS